MKYCTGCHRDLPIAEFYNNQASRDGLSIHCRACFAAYYQENRAKVLENNRRYQSEHTTEANLRSRKTYRKHIEARRASGRAEYWRKRVERAEYNQRYCASENGRNIKRIAQQRRKARAAGLADGFSQSDWQFALGYFSQRCAYCGASSDSLAQDHFLPISSGGGYSRSNIVPSCPQCNSSKHDDDPIVWATGRGAARVQDKALERISLYLDTVENIL